MSRTMLILMTVALLVAFAAPAIADNRHNHKKFDHDFKKFDRDNDFKFRFVDFDDDFGDFFDHDFEQEADSGAVDQSFVVTNTGDNSNQCVGVQGVANTGNAQNLIGVSQFGDGFFDSGFFNDFEIEDSGAFIEVSPTNTTSCDQQVNQAATASG